MLAKGARLTRSGVATVLARGLRFGDHGLGLRVLTGQTSHKRPKFAIVVPAKQVSLAVSRHLIKRRVRSVLHSLTPELPLGLSLIIFCGATTESWSTDQLAREIKQLLVGAKLIQ